MTVELRFLRKVHGTGYYIDGIEQTALTNEVLQYRCRTSEFLPSSGWTYVWSEWKTVETVTEQSK